MSLSSKPDPKTAVLDLFENKYKACRVLFWGGSTSRGTHHEYSDIDLVVVMPDGYGASRESYTHHTWPVEALLAEEVQLTNHFFRRTREQGSSALPTLVYEGVVLPGQSTLSDHLKSRAKALMDRGPLPLSAKDHLQARYGITYMLHKFDRNMPPDQVLSIGSFLHGKLADYYLRANMRWSGTRTSLAWRLREEYPELAARYHEAFTVLFQKGDAGPVQALAREMLFPHGGTVESFEYRYPPPQRRSAPELNVFIH